MTNPYESPEEEQKRPEPKKQSIGLIYRIIDGILNLGAVLAVLFTAYSLWLWISQ